MSITPHPSALKDWHTVKPSSFAQFLLMCEVHDSREPDVWLDEAKAKEYGIGRTAYYFALEQLAAEKWIEFSRREDGKKRWRIIKGKSANADSAGKKSANADTHDESSANADFEDEKSANADESSGENPQTRTEKSANADSPLKDEVLKEEITQESEDSFVRGGEAPAPSVPPGDLMSLLTSFSLGEVHRHFFPDYELKPKDKQTIKNRVTDKRAWILALKHWSENNHRAESIGRQCDKHDEILKEEKKNANGIGQKYGQRGTSAGGSAEQRGSSHSAHLKPRGIGD